MKHSQRGSATVWIIVVASIAVVIGGLVWLSKSGSSPTGSNLPIDKVAEGDWVTGKKNSNVVLVEYADFQCPACGAYSPIMKQLETDYADKVAFVFRHFPLRSIHINADPSARAAEAAGKQGKFAEMRDKLFETQSAWSTATDPAKTFEGFANELGLNVDTYRSDVNSQATRDRIQRDVDSGKAAGVTGTPTFFLNGTKLKNPSSVEAFKQLIDDAITKAPVVQAEDGPYHAHADFAVFVDGTAIDFTQDKYQSTEANHLDEFTHFHNQNGKVAHFHKNDVTVGRLFTSLKMNVSPTCLTTDDGVQHCTSGSKKFSWYVNGTVQTSDPATYVPTDLDRIVFIYGTDSTETTQERLNSVSNDACIYSETCPERGTPPEEECVGGLGTDCTE